MNVTPLLIVKIPLVLMFPTAVLVPPFASINRSKVAPGIFCVPAPLKQTVLGIAVVTFSVPAVTVKTFEIPRMELVDNKSEVAFSVTLYRLTVPLRVAAPVKVAVPAVAVRLPLTSSALDTEKLELVLIVPGTRRP